jgi:formate dehydrogenase maturation protein FdhE
MIENYAHIVIIRENLYMALIILTNIGIVRTVITFLMQLMMNKLLRKLLKEAKLDNKDDCPNCGSSIVHLIIVDQKDKSKEGKLECCACLELWDKNE